MANPFNRLAAEHEFDAETESNLANAVSVDNVFAPLTDDEKAVSLAADLHSGASSEALTIVPEDAPPVITVHPKFGEAKTVYVYRDGKANLRFCAVRFEWEEDGELKKAVLPATWCNLGDKLAWRFKGPKGNRTLYHADEIAQNPEAVVFFAEGEKTADAVPVLFPGMVGTTTLGGCGSPHLTDFSPLSGRTVVVSPDNDEPGRKYAAAVAQLAMAAGAKEVRLLRPERLGGENPKRGWDLADAVAEGWTAEKVAVELAKGDLFEAFPLASNDNRLPSVEFIGDFRLTDEGVAKGEQGEDGKTRWTPVCSWLRVAGLARDISNRGWSLVVDVRDADGQQHEIIIPYADMAGDGTAVLSRLMNAGLRLASGRGVKSLVLAYLNNAESSNRVLLVEKCGHVKGKYILPNRTYGPHTDERVVFTGRTSGGYKMAGDIAAWHEIAALAVGNSRLLLALAASLVGPVLMLVNAQGGGIHLVGRSSIGKSTMLLLAEAIWGIKFENWNSTLNGLEGKCLARNHGLLLLDEVSQGTAKTVGSSAYLICNGTGRTRADRNGDAREVHTWLLFLLSSGEVGIADKTTEDGGRAMAGQSVRLVDINADPGAGLGVFENLHGFRNGAALANHIKNACDKVYGVAADLFLTRLMEDPDAVAVAISGFVEEFNLKHCPTGADGQVRRVIDKFALIAAVGELAVQFGVFPWAEDEAANGVVKCMEDWLTERGNVKASEANQAIQQILRIIESNGASRFDEWTEKPLNHGETTVDKARDRLGWRRMVDGIWHYYATTSGFKEMCSGLNQTVAIQELTDAGILKPANDGKSAKSVTVPGHGKMRLYHVVPPAEVSDED